MPQSLSCILVSNSTTVDTGYDVYFTDTSLNPIVLILPTITGDGTHFRFRNIDVNFTLNSTIITAAPGNTIEGQLTYQLPQHLYLASPSAQYNFLF